MTGTVYFDPAVGGDGSTVTDDSNASTGLGNSGARTRLVPMFQQAVVVAGTCVAKATAAAASATAAATTAIGGAYNISYTFSTTTTDSDPGNGTMRLDNATQNTATTMRTDLLDSAGNTVTTILDTFTGSTSTNKGQIRLSKLGDSTKWLTFNLTAEATPSGYRNFTIANTGSSGASPFSNGDTIILQFTRTGDLGTTGAAGPAASWIRKTANYTAVVSEYVYCDTTGGAFTLTLPAGMASTNSIRVCSGPSASTNNLTIGRNSQTIMNVASNLTISDNNVTVELIYDGTTVRIA